VIGKKLWLAAGVFFFGFGHLQAKELRNWQNVRMAINHPVVVEMRVLSQSENDVRLGRYGSTVVFEGEILEVGDAGMVLKIRSIAGKHVSSEAHMLSVLLGPRIRLVTGGTKEVLHAVTPVLKSDVLRITKKNSKLKRWCTLGIAPREQSVYCPLPKKDDPRTYSNAPMNGPSEDIYATIE
jgi:hypothetical protein